MLCGTPYCSVACLFFSSDLLHWQLPSVQYALKHDFAWLDDEAECLVVLALLQGALLGKCDDQGLGPKRLSILLSARSCCRLL